MLSRRRGLALCLWLASAAGCTGGPISDFPRNDAVGGGEDNKGEDAGMSQGEPTGDGDVSPGDGDSAGNLDGATPPEAPADGGVRDGASDSAVDDAGLDTDAGHDARVTPADAGVPDAA